MSASSDNPVSLPVLGDARAIRPSKSGPRRAIVLGIVQLLMIAHLVQWMISGHTVSPVEPSESMETVKRGAINAGAIFFAIALLATLVLGRWFGGGAVFDVEWIESIGREKFNDTINGRTRYPVVADPEDTQINQLYIVAEDTIATVDGQGAWQFQIQYPAWGRYLVRACDTAGGHCSGRVFYIDWPGWAGRAVPVGR